MSKNHEGDQVLELLWTIGERYGCIERDIRYSIELLLTMKYEECWNPKSARRNLESLIHYCAQKHPDHLRLVFPPQMTSSIVRNGKLWVKWNLGFRIIAELGIKYQDNYIIEVFKEYGLYNKMSIFAENRLDNRYKRTGKAGKSGSFCRQYNVAGPRDLIVFDFSSDSKNSGVNICNNSNISNNSDMRVYDEDKSSDVDCIKEVFNLRRFNIIVNRTEIWDWFIKSDPSSYQIDGLS